MVPPYLTRVGNLAVIQQIRCRLMHSKLWKWHRSVICKEAMLTYSFPMLRSQGYYLQYSGKGIPTPGEQAWCDLYSVLTQSGEPRPQCFEQKMTEQNSNGAAHGHWAIAARFCQDRITVRCTT